MNYEQLNQLFEMQSSSQPNQDRELVQGMLQSNAARSFTSQELDLLLREETQMERSVRGLVSSMQSSDLDKSRRDVLRVFEPIKQTSRRQGIYWILTIPSESWIPRLENGWQYCKGQEERGRGCTCGYTPENCSCPEDRNRYRHWQVIVHLERKGSIASIQSILGFTGFHAELTRSKHAEEYVWKEDTRIDGTQFEFGEPKIRRTSKEDWDQIFAWAVTGEWLRIPADIRIRYFPTFQKIACYYEVPTFMERSCVVYWGETGVGKSRRAWEEASAYAYPKNPRTKWWDSYRGQPHVVIDEFRGDIDIGYLLRWTDRYPVLIETKGSGCSLMAEKFWITSNLHPKDWYPMVDEETKQALFRRLKIFRIFQNGDIELDMNY